MCYTSGIELAITEKYLVCCNSPATAFFYFPSHQFNEFATYSLTKLHFSKENYCTERFVNSSCYYSSMCKMQGSALRIRFCLVSLQLHKGSIWHQKSLHAQQAGTITVPVLPKAQGLLPSSVIWASRHPKRGREEAGMGASILGH